MCFGQSVDKERTGHGRGAFICFEIYVGCYWIDGRRQAEILVSILNVYEM